MISLLHYEDWAAQGRYGPESPTVIEAESETGATETLKWSSETDCIGFPDHPELHAELDRIRHLAREIGFPIEPKIAKALKKPALFVDWEKEQQFWVKAKDQYCELCNKDKERIQCNEIAIVVSPAGDWNLTPIICTRPPGHSGPHVACTSEYHKVLSWT